MLQNTIHSQRKVPLFDGRLAAGPLPWRLRIGPGPPQSREAIEDLTNLETESRYARQVDRAMQEDFDLIRIAPHDFSRFAKWTVRSRRCLASEVVQNCQNAAMVLGRRGQREFVKNVPYVGLDGFWAEKEGSANSLIRSALRHQPQQLLFSAA